MSTTAQRRTRNATEVAAMRVQAGIERDSARPSDVLGDFARTRAEGFLAVLDWVEGRTPVAPASRRRQDPDMAGRELLAAMGLQDRAVREGGMRSDGYGHATGMIDGLKWYLLDPSA